MDLTIRPLTPELVGDYLDFFDHHAFPPGAEWAGCFCYYYHCPASDDEWDGRPGQLNRAGITELILGGVHQGLLAYESGRPVGWCHAAPRHTLPRLVRLLGAPDTATKSVGSILCFVVAPAFRGHGVARQLLTAACESMARQGLTLAEAYPPKGAPRVPHYHGSQALYLEAGFTPVAELERYLVVQRSLSMDHEQDRHVRTDIEEVVQQSHTQIVLRAIVVDPEDQR